MYTIGELAKAFGLSRSTLLYYDRIGVLSPSVRSAANYRLYNQRDYDRLGKIRTYRDAGLSLDVIADILEAPGNRCAQLLEQRLMALNLEISDLRRQQSAVLTLLGDRSQLRSAKVMTKAQWVSILSASGLDQQAQRQWHIEFERDLPEMHTDFLESLGIPKDEIQQIKAWSQAGIEH